MSMRDLMAEDLAELMADTTQFGAGEAVTYTPVSGSAISTRAVISRLSVSRPVLTESGMFETPAAVAYVLVEDVATTDLRDTLTAADGTVWNIESIGMQNAAVRELNLRLSDRKALIASGQQERR